MQSTRIFCTLAVTCACALQAQDTSTNAPPKATREITLEQAVQMALENNLDVKIQRLDPQVKELNLRASYSIYDPSVRFLGSHSFSSQPGGVDQFGRDIGNRELSIDNLPGVTAGLGAELPTGTTYSLSESLSQTASTALGRTVENFSANWQIQLTQPLLQNFWIDPGRAAILINKKELKISEVALTGQIIATVHSVEQAYYRLIADLENVKVAEKGLELAERSLMENKKKVEVGALAPLDEKIAESQVATSKAALLASQQNLQVSENALKSVLTDKYEGLHDVDLIPAEKLVPVPMTFNLQESWQKGLSQKPELLEAKLGLEERDITLRLQRNQLLPSFNLFGSYGLMGNRTNSYSAVLGDLVRDRSPAYAYGGSLTIPLGNIGARNRYKASKAQKEQALLQLEKLKQQTMVQVDNAIKAAQSGFERVQATREARDLAEVALDAEQKKLENGKSTTFQVLQLQRNLTAARFDEVQALADYNIALAQIAFAEGTTLEKHRLSVK